MQEPAKNLNMDGKEGQDRILHILFILNIDVETSSFGKIRVLKGSCPGAKSLPACFPSSRRLFRPPAYGLHARH